MEHLKLDVSGREGEWLVEVTALANGTSGICSCSDTGTGFVRWKETALRQAGPIFCNWYRLLSLP